MTGTTNAFGSEADASALALFDAANAIAVTGDVTVTGTALNTAVAGLTAASPASAVAYASSAKANAFLGMGSSTTPATIDVDGVTTVTAEAEVFASADADLSGAGAPVDVRAITIFGRADASADLDATNSVATGDITVAGTALQTALATMTGTAAASVLASNASYSSGEAFLFIDAPSGDITIDGDVVVTGFNRHFASANGGTGATFVKAYGDSADGTASANLDADGLIQVAGTIAVTGTALNTANAAATAASPASVLANLGSAFARAELNAGNDGSADHIDLQGAVTVASKVAMNASADADLSDAAQLGGDPVLVQARMFVAFPRPGLVSLSAANSVTTGDIAVIGTVLKSALATMTGSAAASVLASNGGAFFSGADAHLVINAPSGDVSIDGNLVVEARYESTAIASASASAGAANVRATVSSAEALAAADIDAANNVTIVGDIDVSAVALTRASGDSSASAGDAKATADLDISGGTAGDGDVTVTGGITVAADAVSSPEFSGGSGVARARANTDIDAADDVTIDGTIDVSQTAQYHGGFGEGSATASGAMLNLNAGFGEGGGDLVVTGNIALNADAQATIEDGGTLLASARGRRLRPTGCAEQRDDCRRYPGAGQCLRRRLRRRQCLGLCLGGAVYRRRQRHRRQRRCADRLDRQSQRRRRCRPGPDRGFQRPALPTPRAFSTSRPTTAISRLSPVSARPWRWPVSPSLKTAGPRPSRAWKSAARAPTMSRSSVISGCWPGRSPRSTRSPTAACSSAPAATSISPSSTSRPRWSPRTWAAIRRRWCSSPKPISTPCSSIPIPACRSIRRRRSASSSGI